MNITEGTPESQPGRHHRPKSLFGWYHRANKKILFGGVIVAVAIGSLMATSLDGALTYYKTVDELKAEGPAAYGERYRVGGRVLSGTIDKDANNNLSFVIYHNQTNNNVPVRYKGITPDIFGDEVDVIVEGKLGADGIFYASNVIAQHPPEFKVADPDTPHEPVSDEDRALTQ